jgi:hypothetical protein
MIPVLLGIKKDLLNWVITHHLKSASCRGLRASISSSVTNIALPGTLTKLTSVEPSSFDCSGAMSVN